MRRAACLDGPESEGATAAAHLPHLLNLLLAPSNVTVCDVRLLLHRHHCHTWIRFSEAAESGSGTCCGQTLPPTSYNSVLIIRCPFGLKARSEAAEQNRLSLCQPSSRESLSFTYPTRMPSCLWARTRFRGQPTNCTRFEEKQRGWIQAPTGYNLQRRVVGVPTSSSRRRLVKQHASGRNSPCDLFDIDDVFGIISVWIDDSRASSHLPAKEVRQIGKLNSAKLFSKPWQADRQREA